MSDIKKVLKHFHAMKNTQKVEEIKTAKMQKLKDLEEDNTCKVLFQSNHNTFFSYCFKVHLQFFFITDPLLKDCL